MKAFFDDRNRRRGRGLGNGLAALATPSSVPKHGAGKSSRGSAAKAEEMI